MRKKCLLVLSSLVLIFSACKEKTEIKIIENPFKKEMQKYFVYPLTTDLSVLSENDKKMLPILIDVAKIMDELHWQLACGPYSSILDTLKDEYAKQFFNLNYGPWDRLNGNKPFIEGVGQKPAGAYFYPIDMTKEEFENLSDPQKTSLYTIIKRNENGQLIVVPYSVEFKEKLQQAADLMIKASEYADDPIFKQYLQERAKSLTTDQYFKSDMLWMDVKNSNIEFVVGPIENYEDELFGYKAAFEAFILVKDQSWSQMLSHYSKLLPKLQEVLPTDPKYKQEKPGTSSDLNAYDAIYYAGDCNAGSKTIAINLPNDEQVQLKKGSRRLQLKNSMRAKFDSITMRIAEQMIEPDQQKYVTFNAFFSNTMFHEVAHGLGIKNTITTKSTVRESLKDLYNSFEEGKADIVGLWLVGQLIKMNEYDGQYKENLVTFVTNLFRSIRFGSSSAHGKANVMCYNYFIEKQAITRTEKGQYIVNFDKIPNAIESLSNDIITIQGNGNYEDAKKFMDKYNVVPENLKNDIEKINSKNIPVDVIWQQGLETLKL